MKRPLLMTTLCLWTFFASAEIRFESIDNIGATNVTLVDLTPQDSLEINNAVLHNYGKVYNANKIKRVNRNGKIFYKLSFQRLRRFRKTKVVITVNGKNDTINIRHAPYSFREYKKKE